MMRKSNYKRSKHCYQDGGVPTRDTTTPFQLDENGANVIVAGTSALRGIGDVISAANTEVNVSPFEAQTNALTNQQFVGSNADLRAQSASFTPLKNLTKEEEAMLGKKSTGEILGDIGTSMFEGATTGAATGNPIIAGGLAVFKGLTSGLSNLFGQNEVERAIERQNRERRRVNNIAFSNLNNAANANNTLNSRNIYSQSLMNLNAFGGLLETNGADWKTGASFIDNGGTHQENPFGGVQFGIASDGMPNLVEEGEVVIKVRNTPSQGHSFADGGSPTYDDYVVSNREFPILEEIAGANITENPEQYVGQSWADIYKDVFKKSHIEEVINRQDSKDYIDMLNDRVARAHEMTRLRNQQKEIMDKLKKATPEQQDLILQQAGYPNLIEEAAYAAHGGQIHIKPSKRGTFTAAATKHGMGVQEFASKVLANKEDYSPAMVKKANFARNASHWHQWGGWKNQEELNNYYAQQYTDFWNKLKGRRGNNINSAYLTGAQARQWINQLEVGDEQQKALASMLKNQWGDINTDWSNKATWEFKNKYNPKGTITESSPYITWAGDNDAMKDSLWGVQHVPQLSVDSRYTYRDPEIILPTGPQSISRYWTYNWNTGERTPITEEEYNNPAEGWTAGWEEYGPETEGDLNSYRDLYLTNHEFTGDNVSKSESNVKSTNSIGFNTDGILPTLSGLNVVSDAFNLTNTPDYSNAAIIPNSILTPRYIGYNPVTRHQEFNPVDRTFIANRMTNEQRALENLLLNQAGSNPAMAAALLTNAGYNGQTKLGEAMLDAAQQDLAARNAKINADNQADLVDAQNYLSAARANQDAWQSYANSYLSGMSNYTRMREDIDNRVAANRSANWNNFLENLQGYFDNQRNRNMANSAYQGTGYWIDEGGTIHYTTKNPSNKTKKEAERRAEEIENKKGE